jgi:hypothetical protein
LKEVRKFLLNLILLFCWGDRYGWRPLPYEIPVEEFEEIKSVIKDDDDLRFLFWEGDVLEEGPSDLYRIKRNYTL